MGPVFRGEDLETSRAVAVTVVRVGLSAERATLAAAALSAMRERWPAHPGLPGLLDSGVIDDEPYLVTTLPDGDPLDAALRQFGPAQLVDAVPRLRTVADALDAAAAVGFCHGRLHPREIAVSVDGTMVTGLGLVPLVERLGVELPARRPYAAPEVVGGCGSSPAADQHALAAIAYEWLTGRPVPDPLRLALPGLSADEQAGLAAAIARAMAVDPAQRFATATAFVDAVGAVLPEAAPRPRASRRVARAAVPRLTFDEGDLADAATGPPPDLDLRTPAGEIGADAASAAAIDDAPTSRRPGDLPLVVESQTEDSDVGSALADEPMTATPVTEAQGPDLGPMPSRPWARWAAGTVAFIALTVVGGWLLLRLGTPSRPMEESSASAPATAPAPESPSPAAPTAPAETPASAAPASAAAGRAAPAAEPPPAPAPAETPAALAAQRPATAPSPARAPKASAAPRDASRQARAPSPATVRADGRLLVRSTPSGAEVFVNGSRRGVTPVALRDLRLGAHAVRVVRSGFATVEQRVVLDSGRPSRSVEVALTRVGAPGPGPVAAASTGVLVVESRPPGARVTIDGSEAGVTPLTMAAMSVGEHAVRIEQTGYAPIRTTARVEAGAKARVAVTLTPTPERLR